MYVPGGTGSMARISTLAKLQQLRPSDGKHELDLVMGIVHCHAMYSCMTKIATLVTPPLDTT
jgi:hypothetical protein